MWVKENLQTREDFIFLSAPHTKDPLLPQSVWRSQRGGLLVLGEQGGFAGVLQVGKGFSRKGAEHL